MAITNIFNKTRAVSGINQATSTNQGGHVLQAAPMLSATLAPKALSGATRHKPRLGKMLQEKGWITQEQLEAALLAQMQSPGKKLGEVLVEKGFIDALKLQDMLDAQTNEVDVEQQALPPLPADAAEYTVLDGRILYVLAGRQTQMALQSWVAEARRAGIEVAVKTCDMTALGELRSSTATASHATLPAIRATRRIIAQAVAERASDIHLTLRKKEDGNGYLRVQFRIDNDVEDRYQLPQNEGEVMIRAMFQGMAAVADAQYQETEDQHAVIANPALLRDEAGNDLGLTGIRLARAPLHDGMNLAARLLYRMNDAIYKDEHAILMGELIRRLGYSKRQVRVLLRLAQNTMGINPFTGPTGSGKSSSLANMILTMLRVRHGIRIITIEDPVEFVFASDFVWQYRIANANTDEEKNRAFSGKLKTSLRQDPDIIMLGEIRGLETAKEAVNAAITGHQVWTTLHVSDPFMIVRRLVAMGVDGFYLQDPKMLSSLIAQRLVKKLCPHCAIPATREAMVEAGGGIAGDNWDALMTWVTPEFPAENVRMAKPGGCECCNHKGTFGRTVVAQVIATDEDLLVQMVNEGPMRARKQYMARPDAELAMEGHAILKVLAGLVDIQSVVDALGPILPRPDDLRSLTLEDL